MKNILLLFFLFFSISNYAQFTGIPEINFEKKLISPGIDSGTPDEKVLTSAISSVTALPVDNSGIKDLTAIQDFLALKELYCYYNSLTNLDLSKNTNLTIVQCYNNNLTNLNLEKNISLTYLDCSANELMSLDVSKNLMLKKISFSSNQLTSINVSKNDKLETLQCNFNKRAVLDIQNNKALVNLMTTNNQITSLDVSKLTDLNRIECGDNLLKSLDSIVLESENKTVSQKIIIN